MYAADPMKIIPSLVAAILLSSPALHAVEPKATRDQAQPAAGSAFSGKLSDARADGTLQFTPPGQTEPRALKLADLVRWGDWRQVQPGAQVVLHDGSFLVADVLKVTDQQITADSINGLGEITLPRAAIRAIVLQPLRWKPLKPRPTKDDTAEIASGNTLVLANGDRRAGHLAGWQAGTVLWQTGESSLRVPGSSVVAIEFPTATTSLDAPAESNPQTSDKRKLWLGFTDGSRVLAHSFVHDKTQWRIKLAAGGELLAELEVLAAVQPLDGRAVYLSDLPAAGYKSIPWLTTTWDYTRDRNVTGGELRVAGSLALKGLGMHSASRLTYNLDKKYERFAAHVGIDDSTEGRGHALARVYGDRGDGQWELLAETPALRGGGAAVPVDVNVTALQRLALVVDFAGDGDAGDHVDWLDARVIRTAE